MGGLRTPHGSPITDSDSDFERQKERQKEQLLVISKKLRQQPNLPQLNGNSQRLNPQRPSNSAPLFSSPNQNMGRANLFRKSQGWTGLLGGTNPSAAGPTLPLALPSELRPDKRPGDEEIEGDPLEKFFEDFEKILDLKEKPTSFGVEQLSAVLDQIISDEQINLEDSKEPKQDPSKVISSTVHQFLVGSSSTAPPVPQGLFGGASNFPKPNAQDKLAQLKLAFKSKVGAARIDKVAALKQYVDSKTRRKLSANERRTKSQNQRMKKRSKKKQARGQAYLDKMEKRQDQAGYGKRGRKKQSRRHAPYF